MRLTLTKDLTRPLILPVVALLCPLVAVAAGPAPAFEQTSWQGRVAAGKTVSVINTFGNVRARFGGYDGLVEVRATMQQPQQDADRLELHAEHTPTGVTLRVRRPGEGPRGKRRADLVVFVPQGVALQIRTDEGLVDARGLRSSLEASTASGPIKVRSIDGELQLSSKSGSLLAFLEPRAAHAAQSLRSGNGAVTVSMNEDQDLTLHLEGNGLISTDFSMMLDYAVGRQPRKKARVVVGKGTTVMTLASRAGHIRVLRRPLARKARTPRPTP